MGIRYLRMWMETTFVVTMIMLLKSWIFPFFIYIWFPTNDLSSLMLEWTVLMVGMITCFIYLGLGSSAKYVHQLSIMESFFLFLLIHVPLFLLGFSGWSEIHLVWQNLIGDLFALFAPEQMISEIQLFFIYLLFFLMGRIIQVKDQEPEEKEKQAYLRQVGK